MSNTPIEKKEVKTMPIAASLLIRARLERNAVRAPLATALITAPRNIAIGPRPPVRRKAKAIPGRIECEIASLNNAERRTTSNVPTSEQTPEHTTAVRSVHHS
jgi:hypothetical protein